MDADPGAGARLVAGALVVLSAGAPSRPCEEELRRRPGAQTLEAAGARGQVVAWLEDVEQYLVQTFNGEFVRVGEGQLREFQAGRPVEGDAAAAVDGSDFDAAFPASAYRDGAFVGELVAALNDRGYCVVQMTSSPADLRSAVLEAEDAGDWDRPIAEFEATFMGRRPAGKKVAWLRQGAAALEDADDSLVGDGLLAADRLLMEVANFVIPESPHLGFQAASRTNAMLHAPCMPDEEEQILQGQRGQTSISSEDLLNHLAFGSRRKLCMMYILNASGGSLTLHPFAEDEGDGGEVRVACRENQVVVFRHDLFDYTFEPAPKQVALQAWVLRERLEGEGGLGEDRAELVGVELRDRHGRLLPQAPKYTGSKESVDVTALACRLSGNAWTPEEYWLLLTSGTDCMTEVPLARWDHDLYYSEQSFPGKGYVRHFGFLEMEQLATFDNEFFNMRTEDAENVDPVQRVGLEVSYESLFRAGWTKRTLRGAEIAAYYAYGSSEWVGGAKTLRHGPGHSPDLVLQNTAASCAARLHFLMGMRGPSGTVETACSSSLTATALMHSQMRPLRSDSLRPSMMRQVHYGIAVGMHSYFDPFFTIGLCANSMLTHQGRCFTFDGSADGYVRGEGYTAMHYRVSEGEDLARLAMLCGTCMNQDGRSASLTAPHGPSQQECIRHSLREAGVRSLDIQIQELHGTGTPLGDPIEVGALRATMMAYQGDVREDPLIKTSSKSNVGHTELNAGNCGIMKCVLMGIYCTASPNVHLRLLNPHIDATGYPVHFTTEAVDQGKPQGYHGVSSFGFGGSNARGDIWARAQAGPRNTQPLGLPLDLSRARLEDLEGLYGVRAIPWPGPCAADARSAEASTRERRRRPAPDAPGAPALADASPSLALEDAAGFSGNYLTGGLGDGAAARLAVRGSFNGWSVAADMDFDLERQIYTFAFALGETRLEHFRLACEGLGDIFPAIELAPMDALVLGPGKAPATHMWAVDGRFDKVPAGTVYRITFKWDADTGLKRLSWMPSTDARSLQMARMLAYQHRYFVLGSWNSWTPMLMQAVRGAAGTFETSFHVGLSGHEEFYFQRDVDSAQSLYPLRACAALGEEAVPVCGPDRRCGGRHWSASGRTGDLMTLRLSVAEGAVELEVIGPRARRKFQRAGGDGRSFFAWDGAVFAPMAARDADADVYVGRLTLGPEGVTEFQIVVDEDPERALYPELPNADQGLSMTLGPDARGIGRHWEVEGAPGGAVEVTLDLSRSDKRHWVSWRVDDSRPAIDVG